MLLSAGSKGVSGTSVAVSTAEGVQGAKKVESVKNRSLSCLSDGFVWELGN